MGVNVPAIPGVSKIWVNAQVSAVDDKVDTVAAVLGTSAFNPVAYGVNFSGWTISDGELSITHLSTTTPSITDGDLILTYEEV